MRLLVAPALLVGVMGCAGTDDQAIIGIWTYDSFTRDGETIAVEVGMNTAIAPFVEFGESMGGVAGCNGFEQFEGSSFRLEDGELRTGEVIFEAAGCAPEALMESELAFQGVVWQDSPISVSIDGDHMTWQMGDASLEFTRVDVAPLPPPLPPQTSVGPLDCSPDPLARTRIPAEDTTAGEVAAESDPRVIRVEVIDEFDHQAYGYDVEDEIVVVVQFDDLAPETFSLYICP